MGRVVQFITVLLFYFLIPQQNVHTGSFTINDIMSAPFTSNLVAAPAGDAVAWVFNIEGRQNIWVASGPEFKARQLTAYDEDDGKPISGLSFTRDGSNLVYTRGSQFNPSGDPEGPDQAIYIIDADGGEPRRLVGGSNPVASPDGETLLYTSAGEVFAVPLDGTGQPKRLFRARGNNQSFQWSPDGKKVLFVSAREVHRFIGVYDLSEETIQWLLPDVYRDTSPVWSPDGRSVAFIRTPPGKHREFPPWRRSDLPFSIYVVDMETGEGRKVWETPTGGGFAQNYPAQPLTWCADDRLVFYSEHTGWMHLYSVPVESGDFVALTSGEYEVEHMTVTPDRRSVIFNSNKDDIDRRHLWTIPVTGGTPELLTPGEAIEWSPVVSAGGDKLFFVQSTARRPGQPVMMNLDDREIRLLAEDSIPSLFPKEEQVFPEQVVFQAADGVTVHSQLFMPRDAQPGDNLPAVIYMHGGPIRQMYLGWHDRGYYHYNYAFNQYLVARGYVVLSVNFRAGIGYGAEFRTAENQGPYGASEYQDILAAAEYLRARPEIDRKRIGLWGGSYGGYLTALGLARNSDIFAAGFDLHGVHDWRIRGDRREGGGWGIFDEVRQIAYESSPVADIEKWTSPVLFVHADDDRNVDFIQTTDLVRRLQSLGNAHVETLVFPDDVHSFLLYENWIRTFEAADDFFERFLRN
jgi:dipeptidyl aminopeptidase/acylaminoacyl peptidase